MWGEIIEPPAAQPSSHESSGSTTLTVVEPVDSNTELLGCEFTFIAPQQNKQHISDSVPQDVSSSASAMLEAVAVSGCMVKSQQIGEAELTMEERREELLKQYQSRPLVFLERYQTGYLKVEMGSTRDESNEEKLEEDRGLNRRSSLRRGKRVRYHLEEQEEGHEHDEEEGEEEGCEHDEEEEDVDVTWSRPGSSSRDTLNQRTPNGKRASFVDLDVIPVTCGRKKGTLDVEKLARGEVCIECEGCWFSPTAFENFAGKGYYKKWKQSIFSDDQSLELLFKQGLLTTLGFKKRNTEDKKMNNCRKMEIGGNMTPVQQRKEGRDDSEMKEGEKKFLLKEYEDIGGKSVSKQQRTCLKVSLMRLSVTKRSILSSNSREYLESENRCMPLEDYVDDDETQHTEEPREDSTGTETGDTTTTEMPLLTTANQTSDLPHLISCQYSEEVNAEEITGRCRDREMCDNQIQEDTEIKKASCDSETCRRALPITLKMMKEEQIKTESDGQSSSHDGHLHTSGSENNTQPVATGKTNDETTVQQQSIQSEPATSALLSQNHHLPSSVPSARDQNTKIKTYGFKRKRPLGLTWKQGCCGQNKAQEKKRQRREMVMLTTLRKICDSQHRMCQALERLCSKQDTVIELLKRLKD